MHRVLPLAIATILLVGCGPKRLPKPEPMKPAMECPSWLDAAKGRKSRLADEIDAAPKGAVWPDVLVEDQGLKDQLASAGCHPVNNRPKPLAPKKK